MYFFLFLQIPSALFPMIKYLPYPNVSRFTFFHSTILLKKNELFPNIMSQYADVFQTENVQNTTLWMTGLAWFYKEKEIISIIGWTSIRSWEYIDLDFGKIIMLHISKMWWIWKRIEVPTRSKMVLFNMSSVNSYYIVIYPTYFTPHLPLCNIFLEF